MISTLRGPVVRLFLRAVWTPAWTTAALASALLTLAGLGQVLLASSVAPPPGLLLRLLLGVAGSIAPLALAVGALAGVAGGVARLREENALLALAATGLSETKIALLAAVLLIPVALAHAGLGHFAEPLARASVRDTRAATAAAITPRANRPVRVGPWWAAVEGAELVFTDGVATGRAARWALSARQGGVFVELEGTELRMASGERIRAEHVAVPIPIANRGKVHVSERTTPDLVRQLAISASLGRDGLERWLLWKRSLLAALLVPLGVAAAGLARRRAPGLVVGSMLVGAWVAVRLCDAAIEQMGAPIAAITLMGGAVLLSGWAWRR